MSLVDQIVDALDDTPWWVYVLFFYLLSVGLKARRPGTRPLWKMAIMPVLLTVWGIYGLLVIFPVTPLSVAAWLVALAAGAAAGWAAMARAEIRVDREHGRVWTPGGNAVLVLILVIFSVKYAFGYAMGRWPQLAGEPAFYLVDLGVSGLIAGRFVGTLACLLRRYRTEPSEPLEAPAR